MQQISFYDRAKELVLESKDIKVKVNQILSDEFQIHTSDTSRRFKSLFGKSIREALEEVHIPSREQIEIALLTSNTVIEMQDILNLDKTSSYWKGLLDREFGYSTYQSAKANFISKLKVSNYNPNRDDNISIIISQRLGDGYMSKDRKSLRIAHSIKQTEYLRFKVALLKRAYPEANPVSSITKHIHNQGHEYVSYYSGTFSESAYTKVLNMTNEELIDNLTPLGWLLWYLDDGYNSVSKDYWSYSLGIACKSDEIKELAHKKLLTYGFNFNIQPTMIILQDKVEISRFINSMLKPFEHIIPECMKYKIEMKI